MTEKLLQFIWQSGYFNHAELRIVSGEEIQILAPGVLNLNQGPDFHEAKVAINSIVWVGNVEIHLLRSDWFRHTHDKDRNYHNVILHVVWEDDQPEDENQTPVLVLQDRVPKLLLQKYEGWMHNRGFIPCERNVSQMSVSAWQDWKSKLSLERLRRKSNHLQEELIKSKGHWEEIFWWKIASCFGNKVNTGAFEAIAKTLPVSLLARHKHHILQLEALLMGQGGLLNKEFQDEYPLRLNREYLFLKAKYKLESVYQPLHFLRMRPGNFPTLRLAQLAKLISQSSHLFSKIREGRDLNQIKSLLAVDAGNYWSTHYIPDEPSSFKIKSLGDQIVESIIINTIIPLLYAYGTTHRQNEFIERAIAWLNIMAPEKNSTIEQWRKNGIIPQNAAQSQALLELKNQYCELKRCLHCAVGNTILKNSMAEGSMITPTENRFGPRFPD